jgi:hypothetical protein
MKQATPVATITNAILAGVARRRRSLLSRAVATRQFRERWVLPGCAAGLPVRAEDLAVRAAGLPVRAEDLAVRARDLPVRAANPAAANLGRRP